MPSLNTITTGSELNKVVSCVDESWGKPWEEISSSLRMYAIGDIKHGWITYLVVVGCLLWNLFLDPDSILYLTGTNQRQFVGELNTLLLESLVGTEIDTTAMSSAVTREDVGGCIRYRRGVELFPPDGLPEWSYSLVCTPTVRTSHTGGAGICGRGGLRPCGSTRPYTTTLRNDR